MNMTDVTAIQLQNKSVIRISNTLTGEIIWPTPSLPARYTRGNCLQQLLTNNRGAFFTIPIGLNMNAEFEIALTFNSLDQGSEIKRNILGCYDAENDDLWGLQVLNNQLYFNEELVPNLILSTGTIYNIIITGTELRINGNLVLTSAKSPLAWNYLGIYDIILMDQSNIEGAYQADIGVYKIRIKEQGSYTYDCIPVSNNNNGYTGMYDLIRNDFYYDYLNPMLFSATSA